jgi:methylated-DNA-[protein]-cysteine S-methyltransferase
MTYQAQYNSPLGLLTMTSDGESLKELYFSDRPVEVASPAISILEETRCWLNCYFNGEKPDFTPQVTPSGTLFQRQVWSELMSIPYGETVTYGDIARRINCKSAQAVGGAVGSNPIAIIIPCHRVIGSDGSLTGYAYGLERKRQLLLREQKKI